LKPFHFETLLELQNKSALYLASSHPIHSKLMKASKCTHTERVFADEKEDAIIVEYSIETSDGNKEVRHFFGSE